MAETWTISVGGRVYGPYTLEQMQAFRAENRLADHSLVSRGDEELFHPAGEDPTLASLFRSDQPREVENPPASEPAQPHRFGARAETDANNGGRAHFVIVADMKSGSIAGLDDEISKLGAAYRFNPQAWVLLSEAPINRAKRKNRPPASRPSRIVSARVPNRTRIAAARPISSSWLT